MEVRDLVKKRRLHFQNLWLMKCAIFLNFRGLIFCDGLMRMAFSWAWLARAAFCLIITMTSASIALIVSTSTFAIPPIFPFIFFPLLPSFFSTIIISLALFSTPPKDRTSPSRQIAHPPPPFVQAISSYSSPPSPISSSLSLNLLAAWFFLITIFSAFISTDFAVASSCSFWPMGCRHCFWPKELNWLPLYCLFWPSEDLEFHLYWCFIVLLSPMKVYSLLAYWHWYPVEREIMLVLHFLPKQVHCCHYWLLDFLSFSSTAPDYCSEH